MLPPSEKYIRLTTFTKAGSAKYTPVWFAGMGEDSLCILTERDSWKVRRITNTPQVELMACDSRGNVTEGVESFAATASIIDRSDPGFGEIDAALKAKYGLFYSIFRVMQVVRRKEPCGIILSDINPANPG